MSVFEAITTVKADDYITVDSWDDAGARLQKVDWFTAPSNVFFLPSWKYTNEGRCVAIEVTGRKTQLRKGALWVRIKITWQYEDGEDMPSVEDRSSGGWLLIGNL